jgi:penicillin-binding protein 1C
MKFSGKKKKRFVALILFLILFVIYWFSLPKPLFDAQYSTVVEDRNGKLLAAIVADDGQWRFPVCDSVPENFQKTLLNFEDKHFFRHPGVNPVSLFRALIQNLKQNKKVSGGSTLTMQVIRLSKNNPPRTIWEKFKEVFQATRLEISYSKDEILALYASHAPFGGNVVGLEAASWRYFGRSPFELSMAESAMLAVLPNAPGLIFPGKNHPILLKKRNKLLETLYKSGEMNEEDYLLAIQEPLPEKPYPLPQKTKHLLNRAVNEGKKHQRVQTSINGKLQMSLNDILMRHYRVLLSNGIHNAATLILHVETGEVLAYAGNIPLENNKTDEGHDVDVIKAPRSTGSILKPLLYVSMLHDGIILPDMLMVDIPTNIGGYFPKNFNLTYDGMVPAKKAISRSLNVPAVRMLQDYGIEKFNHKLKTLGMTTLTKPAEHYGLSVILGGAEGSLWDIAGIYAGMARTLNHYWENNGQYNPNDFRKPHYELHTPNLGKQLQQNSVLDAASIYLTFQAMVEVSRPDEEANWKYFNSSSVIAWKTGTSFGHRDGWAVGVTPEYVVAVWTGNSSGEGRPGLTGIATAAPILFDVFNLLKPEKWFEKPFDEMAKVPICRLSGHRVSGHCESIDSVSIQLTGLKTPPCPYHHLVHLDQSAKYRVNSNCEQVANIQTVPWFVLPPVQEWYYKSKNPVYKTLPPFRSDCASDSEPQLDLIYPRENYTKLFIPIELDGKPGKTVFEAVHRIAGATIFWHLDNEYLGNTKNIHQMGLFPNPGKHVITLVDENGESLSRTFEVIGKGN